MNVFKIHVPPLRDRREDIPLLARNVIWHLSLEEGKDVHEIDDAAIRLLQTHPFRDNITELTAILERAHRSARHASLKPEDLRPLMTAHSARTEESPSPQKAPGNAGSEERQAILEALMRNQWSRQRAARELGMDRTTLWRKMKRMGIQSTPHAAKGDNS